MTMRSPPRPPSPQNGPPLAMRASRLQETIPFPPFPARNFTSTASINIIDKFYLIFTLKAIIEIIFLCRQILHQRLSVLQR